MREMFSYKPPITRDQFFSPGFAERKVLMCTDVITQIRWVTSVNRSTLICWYSMLVDAKSTISNATWINAWLVVCSWSISGSLQIHSLASLTESSAGIALYSELFVNYWLSSQAEVHPETTERKDCGWSAGQQAVQGTVHHILAHVLNHLWAKRFA